MLDVTNLERAVKQLSEAVRIMKRNTAIMQMRMPLHPYKGLVRLMLKLDLVKEWFEPF